MLLILTVNLYQRLKVYEKFGNRTSLFRDTPDMLIFGSAKIVEEFWQSAFGIWSHLLGNRQPIV